MDQIIKSKDDLKNQVRDFWNNESCGEVYADGENQKDYYEAHRKARYELEPYIIEFAGFQDGNNKDVLEVGVGMGSDHIEWAKSKPRTLTGVDLTPRAVDHTRKRLSVYNLESKISVADAENLPFDDMSFDLVYSWGVLHHSPNTKKAIDEVFRVLRPGGIARIMIYHKYSLTGYMLWIKYGLLAGKPFRKLPEIYANHLESPGTKAFSLDEAKAMLKDFTSVKAWSQLSFGDLLYGAVGQQHKGAMLTIAKKIWPRNLFKKIFKNHGLTLFIEAVK